MHMPPRHLPRLRRQSPSLISGLVIAGLVLLLAGCGRFSTLKTQVAHLDHDLTLRGELTSPTPATGSVAVLVFRQPKAGEYTILDCAILPPGETHFAFSLPPGDKYYLVAFEDRDGNGTYERGEPGWLYGAPDAIDFGGARRVAVLTGELRTDITAPPGLAEGLRTARQGRKIEDLGGGGQVPMSLGQIADLDAPRFAHEVGSLGLWEPFTFLHQYGLGIYFAQPYDPKLTPVLLVHGADGTPAVWKDLAPRLDPKKFQVWYYSYPSGLRLERAGAALEAAVAVLQRRYNFSRLHVVAHSMGGLVSRSYLLQAKHAGHAAWLGHFVTLSTPWAGHEAAALGVEYAPTAIPSWIDMQTNSEFGKKIYEETLPAGMTYDLVFTFHGSNSMVLPASNDSSVSVASQLHAPAQEAARSVRGYDLTHVGILNDESAAQWVQSRLLDGEPATPGVVSATPLGR